MTQPQEVLITCAQGGRGTAWLCTLGRLETSINICKMDIGSVQRRDNSSRKGVSRSPTGEGQSCILEFLMSLSGAGNQMCIYLSEQREDFE